MNADPFANLRPLHMPDAVSWWPPAPGWWLLALLSIALLVWGIRALLRWRRGSRYRQTALRELEELRASLATQGDVHAFAAAANKLLRRAALVRYPRADVAALCEAEWLQFLDRTAGRALFATGTGDALTRVAYDPRAACDCDALYGACRDWLRLHR
jgi:hypothetical protein